MLLGLFNNFLYVINFFYCYNLVEEKNGNCKRLVELFFIMSVG